MVGSRGARKEEGGDEGALSWIMLSSVKVREEDTHRFGIL